MNSNTYNIDREKILDFDQRSKLLKTCRDKSELDLLHGRETWIKRYMLVDLALFSGLRVAEIANLKIGDIELTTKDPYLIVRKGKRGKKRDVYLDKELVRHLINFISWKKKTMCESVEADSPLFTGRNGGHCAAITLMKSFKRAIEESHLPLHFSIHNARHTYATFLLHATNNLRYVQKQLGHSKISMTALYADVLPSENGSLANKILEKCRELD
ncbi:MAG: tyrosine-type recombinase/integrase [Candidatus Dadabacteria bacterium]|nr:tyrosine-type recombinase/integrase [Candidatus Dadabacteria bacterium]